MDPSPRAVTPPCEGPRAWVPVLLRMVLPLLFLGPPACGPGPSIGEAESRLPGIDSGSPVAVPETGPGRVRLQRGLASYGHEVRSLRPCGLPR